MSKRARDRQLAKLAQRRAAERRAAQRRRNTIIGVVGLVVAAVLLIAGLNVLAGDDAATSASPSPSSSPSLKPGSQTGTVPPGAPPSDVACGGLRPAAADEPKPQFTAPSLTIDEKATYTATLQTSCGEIVIRLLPKRAPQTVNSFVFLARKGFFDGTIFHRLVDSIDVVQGGDPTGSGRGGPGYSIPDELKGDETYPGGTVAMANAGANTGGSQFFLITGPQGHNLDGNPAFTIFGEITEGLDVARRINALPIDGEDDGPPTQAIYVERVTIHKKAAPSPSDTPSPTATASPSA
jgi:peptidyl-prolyl cis-trans isomerase B (cyclophilin B)